MVESLTAWMTGRRQPVPISQTALGFEATSTQRGVSHVEETALGVSRDGTATQALCVLSSLPGRTPEDASFAGVGGRPASVCLRDIRT